MANPMCREFVDKYRPTHEKRERATALFSCYYMPRPEEWATFLNLRQFSQQIEEVGVVFCFVFCYFSKEKFEIQRSKIGLP